MATLRLIVVAGTLVGLTCLSCASEKAAAPSAKSADDSSGAAVVTYVVKLKRPDAIAASVKTPDSKASAYVAAALDDDEKLSLPLLMALASKGKLLGYTSSGEWILAGPGSLAKILASSRLAETIAATDDEDFSPVNELLLVYEGEAKPSAAFFEQANLVVEADTTRKNVGYMKIRCQDDSTGIAAKVLEMIRSLPGVVSVDVDASATTNVKK